MEHLIAPSILSANFGNLQQDIEMLNRSEADWIHFDVMDGVFVPNISFGFPILKAVKPLTTKPIDVHLMIINPDSYIEEFAKAGASNITVHYEACTHLNRTIQAIKSAGCTAGVALNPHTPVNFLEDIITDLDLVLIMSVNPGFGGQKFIQNTYKKLYDLKELSRNRNPKLKIEVDGGISNENCKDLLQAGANVLVAGSSVFAAADPAQAIFQLKHP
ncbi:ribulose-phosphate 3-epimerase [Mucilaginibacter arboris]|uniref:Ribulose-phosphate 3-epimerase n=1 Tax=Mucilaginibacter arboris TaxID=2682090 RepID=A0A7K1SXD0_9SPHI|nr:ribulose-phosphate 3-epimerase [Mucilaginibacter arboris]MVN21972.1 ribulose-phosphate 3-epimerase [Mucilaginibacter arboris]